MIQSVISLMAFISGIIFGIFLSCATLLYILSTKGKDINFPMLTQLLTKYNEIEPKPSDKSENNFNKDDEFHLNKIIENLEEFNNPLRSMPKDMKAILGTYDSQSGLKKEEFDARMKNIIEIPSIQMMEKELQDKLCEIKDHSKQLKSISNFLYEASKAFYNFSKDLNKLSGVAKVNMNKSGSQSELKKHELILNNWWQTLHLTLEHMGGGQDELGNAFTELMNSSSNSLEEMNLQEKRINGDGTRNFNHIREHVLLFESKLRERDRFKEKLKIAQQKIVQSNSTMTMALSSTDNAKRIQRLKSSESSLRIQTKKLYDTQKEFLIAVPKLHGDVELCILKSIVENQNHLIKASDALETNVEYMFSAARRMKTQLTNAALSLLQMLRAEHQIEVDVDQIYPKIKKPAAIRDTNEASPQNHLILSMNTRGEGVQGYESSLQKVLEGLLVQTQLKEVNSNHQQLGMLNAGNSAELGLRTAFDLTNNPDPTLSTDEDFGRMNMHAEYAACLAASNPGRLPSLPPSFNRAIGTETCVWANVFSGRIYRDAATSTYFYHWFCAKLQFMMNKGQRPNFIDEFQVDSVEFGAMPPLLLNMRWSPKLKTQTSNRSTQSSSSPKNNETQNQNMNTSSSNLDTLDSIPEGNENEIDFTRDSDFVLDGRPDFERNDSSSHYPNDANGSSSDPNIPAGVDPTSAAAGSDNNKRRSPQQPGKAPLEKTPSDQPNNKSSAPPTSVPPSFDTNDEDDLDYYAACTADIAFRSGMKFKISTRLWINWPSERYASVPIVFQLHLAELSGKIKFGATRNFCFVSFLEEPISHITVRSEIGEQYKLNDIPQLSDFVVKKIKEIIRNRLVYPNYHKLRLAWPRNWWPEGAENEFPMQENMEFQIPGASTAASNANASSASQTSPRLDIVEPNQPAKKTTDAAVGVTDGTDRSLDETKPVGKEKDQIFAQNTSTYQSTKQAVKSKLSSWLHNYTNSTSKVSGSSTTTGEPPSNVSKNNGGIERKKLNKEDVEKELSDPLLIISRRAKPAGDILVNEGKVHPETPSITSTVDTKSTSKGPTEVTNIEYIEDFFSSTGFRNNIASNDAKWGLILKSIVSKFEGQLKNRKSEATRPSQFGERNSSSLALDITSPQLRCTLYSMALSDTVVVHLHLRDMLVSKANHSDSMSNPYLSTSTPTTKFIVRQRLLSCGALDEHKNSLSGLYDLNIPYDEDDPLADINSPIEDQNLSHDRQCFDFSLYHVAGASSWASRHKHHPLLGLLDSVNSPSVLPVNNAQPSFRYRLSMGIELQDLRAAVQSGGGDETSSFSQMRQTMHEELIAWKKHKMLIARNRRHSIADFRSEVCNYLYSEFIRDNVTKLDSLDSKSGHPPTTKQSNENIPFRDHPPTKEKVGTSSQLKAIACEGPSTTGSNTQSPSTFSATKEWFSQLKDEKWTSAQHKFDNFKRKHFNHSGGGLTGDRSGDSLHPRSQFSDSGTKSRLIERKEERDLPVNRRKTLPAKRLDDANVTAHESIASHNPTVLMRMSSPGINSIDPLDSIRDVPVSRKGELFPTEQKVLFEGLENNTIKATRTKSFINPTQPPSERTPESFKSRELRRPESMKMTNTGQFHLSESPSLARQPVIRNRSNSNADTPNAKVAPNSKAYQASDESVSNSAMRIMSSIFKSKANPSTPNQESSLESKANALLNKAISKVRQHLSDNADAHDDAG